MFLDWLEKKDRCLVDLRRQQQQIQQQQQQIQLIQQQQQIQLIQQEEVSLEILRKEEEKPEQTNQTLEGAAAASYSIDNPQPSQDVEQISAVLQNLEKGIKFFDTNSKVFCEENNEKICHTAILTLFCWWACLDINVSFVER